MQLGVWVKVLIAKPAQGQTSIAEQSLQFPLKASNSHKVRVTADKGHVQTQDDSISMAALTFAQVFMNFSCQAVLASQLKVMAQYAGARQKMQHTMSLGASARAVKRSDSFPVSRSSLSSLMGDAAAKGPMSAQPCRCLPSLTLTDSLTPADHND